MGIGTKARIIKIGNSRGVRIPRLLLEEAELSGDVELEVHKGGLVIRPSRGPRAGWDEKFAEMRKNGDDKMLDPEASSLTNWDKAEWKW